jgi:pentatricopeptide repeat protein
MSDPQFFELAFPRIREFSAMLERSLAKDVPSVHCEVSDVSSETFPLALVITALVKGRPAVEPIDITFQVQRVEDGYRLEWDICRETGELIHPGSNGAVFSAYGYQGHVEKALKRFCEMIEEARTDIVGALSS